MTTYSCPKCSSVKINRGKKVAQCDRCGHTAHLRHFSGLNGPKEDPYKRDNIESVGYGSLRRTPKFYDDDVI